MSYCETIRPLNSKYPITTITIPPDQVRRMELRVLQLITQLGGYPMGAGLGPEKGSLIYMAAFSDEATRKQFCDTIDKEIDAGRPSIVIPVRGTNGEEDLKVKFSVISMLTKFHSIMGEIQPLLTFIEENGGWTTSDGAFPGGNALSDDISNETLPPEICKAIIALGNFMGAYFISYPSIDVSSTTLHRDITT